MSFILDADSYTVPVQPQEKAPASPSISAKVETKCIVAVTASHPVEMVSNEANVGPYRKFELFEVAGFERLLIMRLHTAAGHVDSLIDAADVIALGHCLTTASVKVQRR